MKIRSLLFVLFTVTLVLSASASPKPASAQAPTVVLGPQVFAIVAVKPNPKYREMTYCIANDTYFTFEPATKYSTNEYISFYYLGNDKAIAHDEVLLNNLTVVTDDTAAAPMARLVGKEGGENIWEIIVTTAMKETYRPCLEKIKAR